MLASNRARRAARCWQAFVIHCKPAAGKHLHNHGWKKLASIRSGFGARCVDVLVPACLQAFVRHLGKMIMIVCQVPANQMVMIIRTGFGASYIGTMVPE
jgi:hypothetical protein